MRGIYHVKTGAFTVLEAEHSLENDRFFLDYAGRPRFDLSDRLDELAGDFSQRHFMKWFHGPYLLYIYDKRQKELTVTQHFFGAPVPFYVAACADEIYFADSLKKLYPPTGNGFSLNEAVLPVFLYNGFLPGKDTLIRDVYKLPIRRNLVMSRSGIRTAEMPVFFEGADSREPVGEHYERVVRQAVFDNRPVKNPDEDYCMALSGGYDSNCILYYLKEIAPAKHIRGFSVGGARGVDETGTAREIAGMYDGVSLTSAMVTPETLRHMDEIVCRLEGNVYERGIFLQYELGKLLSEEGCSHLICGECADQVFHQMTYAGWGGSAAGVPNGNGAAGDVFHYGYWDTPYEMAAYVVLKKNVLLLRSFGVDGYYPFLDYEMFDLGYRTREMNQRTKEYHKERCRQILPGRVAELLVKQGGTTDMSALFEDGFDCMAAAARCRYYSSSFSLTRKYEPEEAARDYYLTLLYLESFENQFCGHGRGRTYVFIGDTKSAGTDEPEGI